MDYYIDLANGTDGNSGTVHDGKKEDNGGANYAAAAGSDASHIHIAQGALDNDADDDYNGDYLYNVTRGLGALITDYDADDGAGSSVITVSIAGMDVGDTFYIIRAWKTIEHYTSVAADVREAGDVAYVRANTTETVGAADIVFDEDGTADLPIKIVGCDASVNDPWHDASNTKPIIDFNGGAYQLAPAADDFWHLERLAIRNSNDALGNFALSTGKMWRFVGCKFYDAVGTGTTASGLSTGGRCQLDLDGCELVDNNTINLFIHDGTLLRAKDTTFNGGAGGTTFGLSVMGAEAFLDGCSFGNVTAHGTSDLDIRQGQVYARNCTFTTLPASMFNSYLGSEFWWEDCSMPAGWATSGHANACWTVQKETTVVRSGGGAVSAAVLPLASGVQGGLYAPATLSGNFGFLPSRMVIWAPASTACTVTMYIRGNGTWAAPPDATTLWLQASYLSAGSGGARTVVKSDETLTNDNSTWAAFQVTFTPAQAGPVYLDVFLAKYEAARGIYVDLTPVVS